MTWISFWPFDEASSGTGPTTVGDDLASPVNLTITYGSGSWTSIAAGKGLGFNGSQATANVDGTKIDTALHGQKTATVELTLTFPINNDSGTFVLIDDNGTFVLAHYQQGAGDEYAIYTTGGQAAAFSVSGNGISNGTHVLHIAVDTSQATAGNRIKFYLDGALLTASSVTIPQDEVFNITAASHILAGSWDGGSKYTGTIWEMALAGHTADAAEIATRSAALLLDNDTDPAGGGGGAPSPTRLTVGNRLADRSIMKGAPRAARQWQRSTGGLWV